GGDKGDGGDRGILIFHIHPQSPPQDVLHKRSCHIPYRQSQLQSSRNYKTATTMRIKPLCPLRPLW
ncbi:hypothetical protein, partial [Bacteroides acidifaciens]